MLGVQAARLAVEDLVLADLAGARLVLHVGGAVLHVDVGEGVRPAGVADEHRVALGVVARPVRLREDLHLAAVGVLPPAGADALRDDGALRVAADVDHLGAGVGLLHAVDHRHRVELADAVVALQDHRGILPGDRRAGLDLRPRDLGPRARLAALGDEVVDAADAVLVTGIPVLHRAVLDGRVVEGNQLHHRGVQLILVALRRRASLEVRDVRPFLGHDQRPLELPGVGGVDAEVRRQLHRAAHALRDEDERAVGEDRRVERGEVVVGGRHDRAQVLLHQLGMLLHRLAEGAEDHPFLGERGLERRADRDGVEDRVDGDAGQQLLLAERDAELLVRGQQLRIDVVERAERCRGLRRREVGDRLVVDRRVVHVRPGRLGHLLPTAERLQAPIEQPLGLLLLGGDEADRLLGEPRWHRVLLDVGDPAVLVLAIDQRVHFGAHEASRPASSPTRATR